MTPEPLDEVVGAIPWCTAGHETDWVDGCRYCEAAQGIRRSAAAHEAATGCTSWPVCMDGHPEEDV